MGFCSLYCSIVLRWSNDQMSRHLCLDKRLTGGGCLDRQVYTSMCSYHVRFATRLFRSLFVPRTFHVRCAFSHRSYVCTTYVFYRFAFVRSRPYHTPFTIAPHSYNACSPYAANDQRWSRLRFRKTCTRYSGVVR